MLTKPNEQGREPKIRLYTYAMSPYAAKVHCFLLYKRLSFECFYINPLRVRQDLPVGKQIPVLTVGQESRADSTPIGLWLDELFPDRPLLLPPNGEERDRLVALNDWVSNHVIPRTFRFYPGPGIDRFLNGWKLGHVMARTARGGIPLLIRAGWPLLIANVPFARRLVAMADDGLPVLEAKRKLYDDFVARLEGGAFLGGREVPSMADLSAYPQFALFFAIGFRGGDDILACPELVEWMRRMRAYVSGEPAFIPPHVQKWDLP